MTTWPLSVFVLGVCERVRLPQGNQALEGGQSDDPDILLSYEIHSSKNPKPVTRASFLNLMSSCVYFGQIPRNII